jgi:hypothetical protein
MKPIRLPEEMLRSFVAGWRDAATAGQPFFGRHGWFVVRGLRPMRMEGNEPLTEPDGRQMYEWRSVRATFAYLTRRPEHERQQKHYKAAEELFLFVVRSVLFADPHERAKLLALADQINTLTERRARAVAVVVRMHAMLYEGDEGDDGVLNGEAGEAEDEVINMAMDVLTEQLNYIDPSFGDIDRGKMRKWFADAKPTTNKRGGSGNKGPIWVAAVLAVNSGALGFSAAVGQALMPKAADAAALLRKAVREVARGGGRA